MIPLEVIDEGDERDATIISDSASDNSSVTIDNDPDRSYYLEFEDLEDRHDLRGPTPQPVQGPQVVDLTLEPEHAFNDGDYLTDACLQRLLKDWRLSEQSTPEIESTVLEERRTIPETCINNIVYKIGQSLELHNGTFLRVSSILEEPTGKVSFRGRHLLRARNHAATYIPKGHQGSQEWRNELVWIANEAMDIDFGLVKRIVNIHFTNYCHVNQDPQKLAKPNGLFCRLKQTLGHVEVSIEYVPFHEADEGFRQPATYLRKLWRRETRSFGEADSKVVVDEPGPVIDLTEPEENVEDLKLRHQYTFGDGFCGAGGVSCGAQKAGLSIKWAFDSSRHATETYGLNFPNAMCETSKIDQFLTIDEDFLKVDVSHGSPPCQTFSPAHTIESQNDDDNSACIFSGINMVQKAKPRVHTIEETSGLLERHKDTFHRMVLDFIETGYSVRWKILNCAEYGVPQLRRRLVIIASGPGETLPRFPAPTYSLRGSGSLQPFTTINQMIANIPSNAPDHDVQGAQSRGLLRAPFDPNQQARTITCGGGDNNYHPSGQRRFTNREFACLQTFPLSYRFGRREVRRQIGNAVPPALAQAVYGEIIRSLQRTDEEEFGDNGDEGR
ncbi:hypothetical protein EYZ11_000889 [Aspergillus tanneri]|uniref:DNA (cytosine-5-)-methyltransferase n=1 Tax=Aspergillus tanneri TaxID=1220188 RepID=A0A4S3JVY9_9EURO|nr:uncharacterized protein ATNIH1004_010097 [Aspergillus tanneri]KAA8643330.1 hypothetical protein ATNIH1004_010097 [Aspergillus tanneri]THC99622.1 hypothetical protein EYZ11_000889 [Aspergillus tanneri]